MENSSENISQADEFNSHSKRLNEINYDLQLMSFTEKDFEIDDSQSFSEKLSLNSEIEANKPGKQV